MGVRSIDVRASSKEHAGNVNIAVLDSEMKRRPAVVVRPIWAGAFSKESLSAIEVTVESREMQQRATVLVDISTWHSLRLLSRHRPLSGRAAAHSRRAAQRQASAGARDGVKGRGAISLRALRCMR